MKKKALVISIIAAVAVVSTGIVAVSANTNISTIFSRLNIGTSYYDPPAQMPYTVSDSEGILTYEYTTDMEADSQQIAANDVQPTIKLHTYSAESGPQYIYDNQGQLYGYLNFNRVPAYQASTVTAENCCAVMERFLTDNNIDSAPYTQTELINGMKYLMSVPENGDKINTISATFSSEGILIGVTLYNNDVESVSDADKADFDRQLEDFLAENGYTDTITEQTVSYRRVENTLVAYYSLTFRDASGGYYTGSFTLGKNKLFW